MASSRSARRRPNPASPVRIEDGEIGLMTASEFLDHWNPGGKMHPSDAYGASLASLNQFVEHPVGRTHSGERIHKTHDGGYVLYAKSDDTHTPVAVVLDGVLYHTPGWRGGRYALEYTPDQGLREQTWTKVPVTETKVVKYLREPLARALDPRAMNLEHYPHVLRRLVLGGEPLEIRSKEAPRKNKGDDLAILDRQGRVIAVAQNEWGATLLMVADEYKGQRLGQVLGQLWYEQNPRFQSGGFTPAGEKAALRMWENRVRELAAAGWYSDLVRSGALTTRRLGQILDGLAGHRAPADLPEPRDAAAPATRKVLVLLDAGYSFVVYDAKALTADEIDESMIYAYGFFRDSEPVGMYLYRIDYEPDFREMATWIALQMARDDGTPIYVGPGYGDLLELEGPDGVVREGNYVSLREDVLDLAALARAEKRARTPLDRYGEKGMLLLEVADAKWQS
jgi:hypothetical protein